MAYGFSKPETKAIYEAEVRKRMEPPFSMSREQAEMLVAALMMDAPSRTIDAESSGKDRVEGD